MNDKKLIALLAAAQNAVRRLDEYADDYGPEQDPVAAELRKALAGFGIDIPFVSKDSQ